MQGKEREKVQKGKSLFRLVMPPNSKNLTEKAAETEIREITFAPEILTKAQAQPFVHFAVYFCGFACLYASFLPRYILLANSHASHSPKCQHRKEGPINEKPYRHFMLSFSAISPGSPTVPWSLALSKAALRMHNLQIMQADTPRILFRAQALHCLNVLRPQLVEF